MIPTRAGVRKADPVGVRSIGAATAARETPVIRGPTRSPSPGRRNGGASDEREAVTGVTVVKGMRD
ncbi:hypothetical protein [Streptomyces sp. NPDC052107]|uniref:hypothetical protein n=1 Tax=Streptomyces sp. NPDC052107 TaxID=3155632 RepID=UPI00343FE2B2